MSILLRQVQIVDPSSPFHQQKVDVFIENGVIRQIGQLSTGADQEVNLPGLCASPGWTDIFSHFNDPGFEFRETLETGSAAAVSGGYTDVLLVPNTAPVVHNKALVEYLVGKSRSLPVTIHPIGAITKNAEGKELAEMYDMVASGAVAFSDGPNPVQSSGLLLKALQYVKAVNKVVIQVPDDRTISTSGLMNEGIVSTQLGLPGMPAIGEELMIMRDIELAKYTGSKIHITGISTGKSLQLVMAAKSEGVQVTCSVTPYHLYFCDEDLAEYDTNLKVNPPLRTASDREALRKGVITGEVDCIAAHHFPQDTDHKMVEFEYAANGISGIETAFGMVMTALPQLSAERVVALFATNPRSLFGLPAASIDVRSTAAITLFAPGETWSVQKFHSKSTNNPMQGKQLTGKPLGIINKDQLFLSQL
jgi:dihydroorotase